VPQVRGPRLLLGHRARGMGPAAASRRAARAQQGLLLVLLAACLSTRAQAFYLPGVAPQDFAKVRGAPDLIMP